MNNISDIKEYELLCLIINFGLGNKVVKIAKQSGISGCTAMIGQGTIRNRLLEFLECCTARREVFLMAGEKKSLYEASEKINKEFELNKPNHGIAFTFSIKSLIGSKNHSDFNSKESEGAINSMHKAILVIVDKGKAESVIDAAMKAGAKGGTIMNARGSGIHETSTLFFMPIEPEKEVVIIVSENTHTETIVTSIRDHLKIDEPGNGIIFVLDVNKVYGLY